MLIAMRFSLPDRPGTLGSVATALSHTGASIVSLQVVDHDAGYAVDEVCLLADDLVSAEQLRRSVESIPGVVVEAVRKVDRVPDPLAPLELADRLARESVAPIETLVHGLPDALSSAWAFALDASDGLRVVSCTPGAPAPGVMETPFLPLDGARRLEAAPWMPPRWRESRLEIAAAPLSAAICILVGRRAGMRFRPPELRQLEVLTAMTARAVLSTV